jgi:flagellar hook protein FlgE
MIYAMSAGTKGMMDNSNALGVVGSNISNVNTVGFKTGSDSFANYFANALTYGTGDSWNQGSIQATGNATDLAINGKGLFMVSNDDGNTYYTRAGEFHLDADGNLVNVDDLNVQGYQLTADGSLGVLGDINFANTTSPATATTELSTILNLNNEVAAASLTISCSEDFSGVTYRANETGEEGNDISVRYVDSGEGGLSVSVSGNAITVDLGGAEAEEKTAALVADAVNNSDASELVTATAAGNGSGAVEITGPQKLTGGTAPDNFSTTITVYDSMGNAVDLTVDFVYQVDEAADPPSPQWVWSVRSSDGTCETYGVIKFDGSGQMDTEETKWDNGEMGDPPSPGKTLKDDGNPVIEVKELSSGAGDLSIDWDLIATGFASASTVSSQSQNGSTSGTIVDAKIDSNGVVSGVYSNGKTKPLYQIALANFANYSGLESVGGGLFEANAVSGAAIVGTANTGGRGSISAGSLEMSNVDLAQEFVKMITIQRGYQANSRVISTSDEMMQELNSLKR